jgi:hypothetical protein
LGPSAPVGVEILRAGGCHAEGFDLLAAGELVRQARIEDYADVQADFERGLAAVAEVSD